MKPEHKLVAAVILVAIATVLVMKAPGWKKKAKERRQESILERLTPDQAVALCGKPILDETQTTQPPVTRRLVIRNDYALAVELDFAATGAEPQAWRLTAIQDPSGDIKYQTPASQIGVLPCLDEKQANKPVQKQQ